MQLDTEDIKVPTWQHSLRCDNLVFKTPPVIMSSGYSFSDPIFSDYECHLINDIALTADTFIQVDKNEIKTSIAYCKMTNKIVSFYENNRPLKEEEFWKRFNDQIT